MNNLRALIQQGGLTQAQAEQIAARSAALRAMRPRGPIVCSECGQTFVATLRTTVKSGRRFCSNRCRQADKNRRKAQGSTRTLADLDAAASVPAEAALAGSGTLTEKKSRKNILSPVDI